MNLLLELLAVLHELSMAWDRGITKVLCSSDSLETILLRKRPLPTHQYVCLIKQINSIPSRPCDMNIEHTMHEGNQCADFLAKYGAQQNEKMNIWDTSPHNFESLLLANAMGVCFLRCQSVVYLLFFLRCI